jgi:DNA-binding beta-propeller fold protein YncE
MQNLRRLTCWMLLGCMATTLAAPAAEPERAAGSRAPAAVTGPVWPKPPEQARVRFVQSVAGASDWGIARGWWGRMVDTLTGRHELLFVRPTGVAERDGVLYVADAGAQSVVIFDAARHKETRVSRIGDRLLASPVAVAPGPDRGVFVADSRLGQVVLLDADGKLLRVVVGEGLARPSSVAFDAVRGRLYVGDAKDHLVRIYDVDGRPLGTIGGLGSGPGQFNAPTHVAVGPDGRLFVTDALNFRVQVFEADGQFVRQIGDIGDGAGNFAAPKGVAADAAGRLYAVDAMFDAVQVFDDAGRLLLGFGEQGTQPGQFWLPNGMFINGRDELFVADSYNRRIQVFKLLAGSAPSPGSGGGQSQ